MYLRFIVKINVILARKLWYEQQINGNTGDYLKWNWMTSIWFSKVLYQNYIFWITVLRYIAIQHQIQYPFKRNKLQILLRIN